MRISTCGGLAVTLALLTGCASSPPPRTELARAELAVEQAVTNEADQYAPLQLREARQKLDQAQNAYSDENYATANRLAEQAQVTAQLALAETQSMRSEELVRENLRSVEALRQELERREGTQ